MPTIALNRKQLEEANKQLEDQKTKETEELKKKLDVMLDGFSFLLNDELSMARRSWRKR